MSGSDKAGGSGNGQGAKAGATVTEETELLQRFDYLTCSIPDIHGSPRGRVVPRHLVPRVLREGFGLFQGE